MTNATCAVEAIRAIHFMEFLYTNRDKDTGYHICAECRQSWPCRTNRILQGVPK